MHFFFGILLLLSALSPCAAEQAVAVEADQAQTGSRAVPAIDLIRERAKEVAASSGLDEALKSRLGEAYRKAIASLQAAATYREAAKGFERSIQTAPDEAASLRAEAQQKAAAPDTEAHGDGRLSLEALEQRLVEEKAREASLASRLAELKSEIARQQDRPAIIRQRLSVAAAAERGVQAAPAGNGLVDESAELVQARRWVIEAQAEELRAEVLMLGQELASHPMRLALLEAERDLVALELRGVQRRVESLETLANEVRLEETVEAKIEAQVAELSAADKHPLVAELAASNTRLSKDVEALAGDIEAIKREQRQATEETLRIEETFKNTRKKIEFAGVSQILGQVLQEQRRSLPVEDKARRKARDREEKIAQTTLSQILLEEERDRLRDVPAYVAERSASLPAEVQPQIADELGKLAQSRLVLIDQALTVQRRYLQALAELDIAQRGLEDIVKQFDGFLAENLLWVRSSQAAGQDSLRMIPGQLADLLAPGIWRDALDILLDADSLGWIGLAVLVAAALRSRRRHLLQALHDSGREVGNLLRDRLSDTLRAFGLLLLIVLPWPLILLASGWALFSSIDAADFSKRVGSVLMSLSVLVFQLRALQLFVAPGSISQVHFGWSEKGLRPLRHDLRWFAPLLVAMAALTMLTFESSVQHWGAGLGRLTFLAIMALIAVFFFRFARPNGGALSLLLARKQQGLPFRLRYLWFGLLTGSPLVAAGLSLAGYMYTAATLISHIVDTVWFGLLIVVVHEFVIRWLVLNQRRLRLQAARERRMAEQEARNADETPEETEGLLTRDLEEPQIDLNALDAASRKLTNNALVLVTAIGIWGIWRDMLPALGVLDAVTLWSYTKPGVELPIPITLTNIGLALLVLIAMMVATRQLPAFLEVVLLQRLAMSKGSRYTVVTLTKYVVFAVGVSSIFGMLGGSWSEIQWIVAALGVGIGFGLQEIVANFISGLIILFERPIRVGDIVTVGNTDGMVTRIRIRATTIRNWDQKELLVPNKNFITQEVLNWSLSDQTTRLLVNVGVAYGSNVQRAMLIMEEAARNHPRVLAEPAPFVVFETFGDNALMLSLRCYIDNLDYRLRTISDLNLVINQAMTEAGVEIAFPQRDVHLDTRRPLEVQIRGAQPQGEAS